MSDVMTSGSLLDEFDRRSTPGMATSTGFERLDDLTGGFAPGRVWIVTGPPGHGRTTLAAQWAAKLAHAHGWHVRLACPREDTVMCAARLISSTGKVPLHHLVADRGLRAEDARRAETARDLLLQADLQVAPGHHPFSLALPAELDATAAPTAVVIDDADLVPSCSPEQVAALAGAGCLVILTLPRHVMVEGKYEDADLDPAWARVADVVLGVRTRGLTPGDLDLRAGQADLTVLKHRRGPIATATVAFQGYYARFVDLC